MQKKTKNMVNLTTKSTCFEIPYKWRRYEFWGNGNCDFDNL